MKVYENLGFPYFGVCNRLEGKDAGIVYKHVGVNVLFFAEILDLVYEIFKSQVEREQMDKSSRLLADKRLKLLFSFKQAFFTNYTVSGGKFEAAVANVKGFTGNADLVCSNMRVTALYTDDALSKIAITYTSLNGAEVSITYLFTK